MNKVAIVYGSKAVYPCEKQYIEEGFALLGWDIDNYGTTKWNPLGKKINEDDCVLIKPNLVMEKNGIKKNGVDCLYTNVSVVEVILEYVIRALNGKGKIIIGDAPVQGCNFEELVKSSGYLDLVHKYRRLLSNTNVSIQLVDFRKTKVHVVNSIPHVTENSTDYSGKAGRIIDLGADSEFADLDKRTLKRSRVNDYDSNILNSHHNSHKNEYMICSEALKADVIINIPKPKTHRYAGVTISMKNIIGICSKKDYLPHYTSGSISDGGDEYRVPSFLKRINAVMLDAKNYQFQTRENYHLAWIYNQVRRIITVIARLMCSDKIESGAWYGNDTISRTIIDLNKIILYADKEGIMQDEPQRKEIIIADMIIAGEGEGPLSPSRKRMGVIAVGENPVHFDDVISCLMGLKPEYNKTVLRAKRATGRFTLVENEEDALILSNVNEYNNKTLNGIEKRMLFYFKPTKGWKPAFYTKETNYE